jgi:hypothetical protein
LTKDYINDILYIYKGDGIMEQKFTLGKTVMTQGVSELVEEHDIEGRLELTKILHRHGAGDWGDVDEEDANQNEFAMNNGERILSSYELFGKTVWVITEWDRSYTTVLFPSEY